MLQVVQGGYTIAQYLYKGDYTFQKLIFGPYIFQCYTINSTYEVHKSLQASRRTVQLSNNKVVLVANLMYEKPLHGLDMYKSMATKNCATLNRVTKLFTFENDGHSLLSR